MAELGADRRRHGGQNYVASDPHDILTVLAQGLLTR